MFRASDGYPLQYRHWRATGQPRALVVALHGIQSHGGWYQHSSRRLAAAGFEVLFLDRRGSGLNARQRGHAAHEQRLLSDVRQFLGWLRRQRDDISQLPTVLLGVSWGGKLATAYAATYPDDIDALAILYPGLYSRIRPTWWQQLRLAGASAVGWGHVSAPIPLNDPSLFTKSVDWQEFIRRDELALHRVSVDFLRANLRLTRWNEEHAADIRCAVLMMLAGHDEVIDNAANRSYLNRLVNAASVRCIEYPEARHTLEFEPTPDRFIDDLIQWLDETVGGRGALSRGLDAAALHPSGNGSGNR